MAEDSDTALALLADLAVATDPALRRQARRLAEQLLPRLGRVGVPMPRGTKRLVAQPGAIEGDLDLDRTFERTEGLRPGAADQLVTRRFGATPRAVCLLVDRSGSMGGHAVALASVAAAAVISADARSLRCSVVAFASEPLVLLDYEGSRQVTAVVADLLSLRGHGRTDLARALRVAAEQLEHAPSGGRTALLLSDALHTKGADPRSAAGTLDCLHVLGTSADTDAIAAGQALARRGRGRFLPATTLAQLTGSLRDVLR
jgi:Mg-chelatase subunit ChlD